MQGPPETFNSSFQSFHLHTSLRSMRDLFSKWFSESGKLVMKLFSHINDLVEGEDSFVCVLIDEVESLTAARKGALNGAEPSDAIRVVNAVLTQIDQLKERQNVLILTTSNISEAIDLAFVDRADIKQYIGLPSTEARYRILSSCVSELIRVGIIRASTDALATYADAKSQKQQQQQRRQQQEQEQGTVGVSLENPCQRRAACWIARRRQMD